jgi:site-specific DNA-methyltransferase (adenine-specific)
MRLYHGDCLVVMDELIEQGVKVDMILADLPYKETGNKWDNRLINTDELFNRYRQLITDEGAIVLTATMKFAVELISKNKDLYKYDWIWEKDNGTNAPNVNYQPFRVHEYILIFGKGRVTNGTRTQMTYNPQKTDGVPYTQRSGKMSENWKGGLKNVVTENIDGKRHPKTIQKFTRDRGLHPTQKPIEMMEFLIKTYTNENALVLDNCMGSGTTAIACINTNRNFIGIELDDNYYNIAKDRIQKHMT